jgi:predicted glutamine amidotransferase
MCRFLVLKSLDGFDPAPPLARFRQRCCESEEYQGDGWGLAYRTEGRWTRYRSALPVWEDAPPLPSRVELLVAHARSAFRNQGITPENNMPFYRGERVFVFNGELRGVRLRAPGRIGAEKLFHVLATSDRGDLAEALVATDRLIRSRTRYVRAMNLAVVDGDRIHALCRYAERPDYFTLHFRAGDLAGVCSEPLDGTYQPMANGETRVL